jgi:uncharacterized surface protein with fasciclin (FAS1) repeats
LQLLQYHIVSAGMSGSMKTALAGAAPLIIATFGAGDSIVQPANEPLYQADIAARIFPETDLWAGNTSIIMVDRVLIPASLKAKAG